MVGTAGRIGWTPAAHSLGVDDIRVAAGISRWRRAFLSAQARADCSVLLRSLVRLSGGRGDLDQVPTAPGSANSELPSRFGLLRPHQSEALRIVQEDKVGGLYDFGTTLAFGFDALLAHIFVDEVA